MTATMARPQASLREMLTWTSASSLVTATAAALSAGLVVSRAEPATYGDFVVLVAVGLLIANGLRFGTDKMIASEVRRTVGEPGIRAGQDLLALSLVTGAIGLFSLLVTPFDRILDIAQSSPLTTTDMFLFASMVSADVFRLTAAEAVRAQLRAALASITGNAGRAIVFGILLLTAAFTDQEFDRTLLLLCAACASVVTGLASAAATRSHYRLSAGRPIRRVSRHWRGHAAMATATMSATIIGSADIWLVGGLVGSEAAARYSLAVSATALVGILLTASHVAVQPYLADLLGRGSITEAQQMSTRVARLGTLAGGAGLTVVTLFTEPLAVMAGGEAYRGVGVLCMILGLGVLSGLVVGPAGVALIAVGRYATMGRLAVASAAFALSAEISVGFITRSEVPIAFCSSFAVTILHGLASQRLVRLEGLRTDALVTNDWTRTAPTRGQIQERHRHDHHQ